MLYRGLAAMNPDPKPVLPRLIVATRTDLLLGRATEFLREQSARGEVIVVAATRDAADDFVRGATSNGTATALIGVHRTTVDHLAAAIAQSELTGRRCAPLSTLAHEALAARVIQQAREESKLTYFAPVAAFPGFPRALPRSLRDLRLGHISTAHLRLIGGAGSDLAHLLELYESELAGRTLADQKTRFFTATDIASRAGHAFCGLPLILLDVR